VTSRSGHHNAVALALLSAVLFGSSPPLAKLLLRDAAPQLLAGLLYMGSGLGLGMLWLIQRHRRREAPLTMRDAPWLGGAIASGGVLAPLLLMLGLVRTTASGASLLLNLEGVFTAMLAWFVFRENFDRRIAFGMLVIVAGGAVLSWEGRLAWGGLLGPLAVAGACLCWAIDNNLTQKVSAGDPVQITMLKGLVAGTVNVALGLTLGDRLPTAAALGGALLLGFFSYGLSLVLFVGALRHLGTARTGAYFSIAPFVGAGISLVLLREQPTALLITGGLLMGIGVWLHLTERHEHLHAHETLDHTHVHFHDEHHRHAHDAHDPQRDPHSHPHRHEPLAHSHRHYPDIHHRHGHD